MQPAIQVCLRRNGRVVGTKRFSLRGGRRATVVLTVRRSARRAVLRRGPETEVVEEVDDQLLQGGRVTMDVSATRCLWTASRCPCR